MPARASVMAAAEAMLEYAGVGRTDSDRESTLWGSAGQTEAIAPGDRGRLHIYIYIYIYIYMYIYIYILTFCAIVMAMRLG